MLELVLLVTEQFCLNVILLRAKAATALVRLSHRKFCLFVQPSVRHTDRRTDKIPLLQSCPSAHNADRLH